MYRIRVKHLRILRVRKAGTGAIFFVPVDQSSACVASPWLKFGAAALSGLVRLAPLSIRSPPHLLWTAEARQNWVPKLTHMFTAFVSGFCLDLLQLSPNSCCHRDTEGWAEVGLVQ